MLPTKLPTNFKKHPPPQLPSRSDIPHPYPTPPLWRVTPSCFSTELRSHVFKKMILNTGFVIKTLIG